MTGEPDPALRVLRYGEVLGIAEIGALHAELHAAVEEPGPLVLDTARVLQVDTAVLQLWAAAAREVRAHGGTLRWREPSEVVRGAASRLGLVAMLGLDETA